MNTRNTKRSQPTPPSATKSPSQTASVGSISSIEAEPRASYSATPPLVRTCPLVLPLQAVWYNWNTCSDGSAIPEHGKWCSKKHWDRYSNAIESKYKFEYKYGLRSDLRAPNFYGGACPQTLLVCACLHTHHYRCPPNLKYLPLPLIPYVQ